MERASVRAVDPAGIGPCAGGGEGVGERPDDAPACVGFVGGAGVDAGVETVGDGVADVDEVAVGDEAGGADQAAGVGDGAAADIDGRAGLDG